LPEAARASDITPVKVKSVEQQALHRTRSLWMTTRTSRINALRGWALTVQQRRNRNKATCALANKLARICYATLRDGIAYGKHPRFDANETSTALPLPI
jgi:hypothetical protein